MSGTDFDPKPYIETIQSSESFEWLVTAFSYDADARQGSVTYNPEAVYVDPDAPDFSGTTHLLNDEELVRVVTLLLLADDYGYTLDSKHIDIEKVYEAPGRPKRYVKGSRADIIVRNDSGEAFLCFELKVPKSYVDSRDLIEGQLFQSSLLEQPRPQYLIWSTARPSENEGAKIEALVISTAEYTDYDTWHNDGEPSGNTVPYAYGTRTRRAYANVRNESEEYLPLDQTSDGVFFSKLASDLHDVVWAGGSTASNEVFAIITRLFLCKIYDEKEAHDGDVYEFQIKGRGSKDETPDELVARINRLYQKAESEYLASESQVATAFDPAVVRPEKIMYVVRRLESISLTKNVYGGDLLGMFFEEIVAHGFTQTRGQFFTPVKLVDFMLDLADVSTQAKDILRTKADGRGIHRFPYVIDPSCGVGTFPIRYMKKICTDLDNEDFVESLSEREKETYTSGFAGTTHTNWAKTSLFGIENNHDLGLAAKVNMILHGDGSMSTFVTSGLLSFDHYEIPGRPTILKEQKRGNKKLNEQFDLVISNPPFSIKLSDDDKREVRKAFSGDLGLSEELFIERWYQLLSPGGLFCCVLPESICDTSKEAKTRRWLFERFHIKAVVSLPYLTFQPYTSVKTCVVLAEKRTEKERKKVSAVLNGLTRCNDIAEIRALFKTHKLEDEPIFMAEPEQVGYKRRKGLSDLPRPTDLPQVVASFRGDLEEETLKHGFFITLADVLSRQKLRIDPKYCWLWYKQRGEVMVRGYGEYEPLSTWLSVVNMDKVHKGPLKETTKLIELDSVQSGTGRVTAGAAEEVDEIGSDKVSFTGVDIAISKLRPYLTKLIIRPDQSAIGSSEWVGLKCSDGVNPLAIGYMLMLPQFKETYRRLMSGKQHPRFDIKELLELEVDVNPSSAKPEDINAILERINGLERQIINARLSIDDLYL